MASFSHKFEVNKAHMISVPSFNFILLEIDEF